MKNEFFVQEEYRSFFVNKLNKITKKKKNADENKLISFSFCLNKFHRFINVLFMF